MNEAVPLAKLQGRVIELAGVLLKKNPVTLKAAKDAVRRVKEMTYENAEDYLIRAQEAANFFDNEGRKEGIRQFIDEKSYKPGLATLRRRPQGLGLAAGPGLTDGADRRSHPRAGPGASLTAPCRIPRRSSRRTRLAQSGPVLSRLEIPAHARRLRQSDPHTVAQELAGQHAWRLARDAVCEHTLDNAVRGLAAALCGSWDW